MRRRVTRQSLSRRDLTIFEKLYVSCGARLEDTRWPTYKAFLEDYEVLREEVLMRHAERFGQSARPPFGERLRRFVRRHGIEALTVPGWRGDMDNES
jgi:hypothetical protein